MSGKKEKEKRKEREELEALFEEALKRGPTGILNDENPYSCMGWVYGFLCKAVSQGMDIRKMDPTRIMIAAELEIPERKKELEEKKADE